MKPLTALALAMLFALAFAACSSGLTLPDQGSCPMPEPVELDDSDDASYRTAVRRNLEKIQALEAAFRDAHPQRRLRNRDDFRADFARYAHLGRCAADVILGLQAPREHLQEYEEALREWARQYRDALDDGASAVASRNRSAYDRWVRVIDPLHEETRTLQTLLRDASPRP